ncbi:MAG: hypothetical protein AB7O48_04575 [Cyclobacteriaceae bacterium]
MKIKYSGVMHITFMVAFPLFGFTPRPQSINIQDEIRNNRANVINREVTFINDKGYEGIHLNRAYEDGIVWLKDFEFTNGTIEFDVRGEDIKQHSFVGIAFHGNDTTTFESIYLRPFNFKATEDPWKSRSIQYIARPTYTWQALRANFPDKFENDITPVLEPNAWIHMKVVVNESLVTVFVNNRKEPCLEVESLGSRKTGSVGFYVADTSGGDFANLKITKTE